MAEISKATVAVLLVLTILISVIGTWTVLQSSAAIQNARSPTQVSGAGRISLTVAQTKEPVTASNSGRIGLTVVE
jgi:hypothetical protein